MAHVRLGVSFMDLFFVRWCSAGHQEFADPRGDLGLGADLGEVGKSLILGLFYDFISVLLANCHFCSCTGCVQILVLFSVLGWFSKTSLGQILVLFYHLDFICCLLSRALAGVSGAFVFVQCTGLVA